MANPSTAPVKSDDVILLLGRFALGVIFVKSGVQKLMGLGAFAASLAGRGVPQSATWAVIGATVEFIGGIPIGTRVRAREAPLLVILFVIVAKRISHRFWGYADAAQRPQERQFFKNLSLKGGFPVGFVT